MTWVENFSMVQKICMPKDLQKGILKEKSECKVISISAGFSQKAPLKKNID